MTVRTDPCAGCGSPVTREVPESNDTFGFLLRQMKPWCDDCCAAAETEQAREAVAEQARMQHEALQRRIKESGLPAAHGAVSIRQLDHPEAALQAAENWAADGGGLLLTGEIGRGKTTLAGAAALARLRSRSLIWTSAPLLFARLGTGLGSEQREWALDLLANTKALVLDDIDKARPTEYGAEQVFLAVDQRVEHQAPLLVTSNLSPAQLAERWPDPYGQAIASRLVGYCKVVRIEGVDRRLHPVGGPA